MKLFRHENRQQTEATKRMYAIFELLHTLADFGAATLFVIGSVMFFSEEWTTSGTWLFLIGSLLFALKPTLRLICEIKLYRMCQYEKLAARNVT